MTLPASGAISLNNVNVELGLGGTTSINMNQATVRTLFGIPSGAINMNAGHGKSNRVAVNLTISANTKNYNIWNNRGGGYIAGSTDLTLTINSGIVVGSTSTATYALDTGTGWGAGDTISIINNGYIVGKGGAGGNSPPTYADGGPGGAGGPALNLQKAVTITNASGYIYSGGGGSGSAGWFYSSTSPFAGFAGAGGAGNSVGLYGTAQGGASRHASNGTLTNGGQMNPTFYTLAGGVLNANGNPAPGASYPWCPATGGGGGASGGARYPGQGSSRAGGSPGGHGLAIQRNANAITWVSGNTRVYGGTS